VTEKKKPVKAPVMIVTAHRVEGDPPFSFWRVEITDENGVWTEAFGSEDVLRAFVRGLEAGCSFFGAHFRTPEIPRLSP
jgi:hypothetical protein